MSRHGTGQGIVSRHVLGQVIVSRHELDKGTLSRHVIAQDRGNVARHGTRPRHHL